MGDGEYDAFEPTARRPLPREDRVWRHPSEVAMHARHMASRDRRRRMRTGGSLLGGALAVAGLFWLAQNGKTEVVVTSEAAPIPTTAVASSTTSLIATVAFDQVTDQYLVIRSADDTVLLAGGLIDREGFLITSGRALAGADEVVVSWGEEKKAGHVIGYDKVTDVTVIQLADSFTGSTAAADEIDDVASGDIITLVDSTGTDTRQRVVNAQSTSADNAGDPMVGVVELDGRIGDIPPGSPAFNSDGDIVGMTTATAATAPAAIIPIELVREVAGELIDHGVATHPWLGVTARNTSAAGSYITAVAADGPAGLGGVLPGDIIVEIGSSTIASMESMVATLRGFEPGDATTVVVMRDGERVECPVELALHAAA